MACPPSFNQIPNQEMSFHPSNRNNLIAIGDGAAPPFSGFGFCIYPDRMLYLARDSLTRASWTYECSANLLNILK